MALEKILVPDLDGVENVGVVEIYVSVGDNIELETPLISLESDKAVMDVPAPWAGTITEIQISEGDTVNVGDVIAIAETVNTSAPLENTIENKPTPSPEPTPSEVSPVSSPKAMEESPPINIQLPGKKHHATPSVRAFARELGIDLSRVNATGIKGRILREDVSAMVKSLISSPGHVSEFALPAIPSADFSTFGTVETELLSRIKKISGPHLHRNWVGIPHVTQFENADMTDLEVFRKSMNSEGSKTGQTKISPLIFVIRALIQALKEFPDFNCSLNPDGASITRKKFYNIGIAVDTPGGLVVPVIKDADKKGIRELTQELQDLSTRAKESKLKADEMKGSTFSISSLGGIGGTYFTPIINAPEVAILGLSRAAIQPVWNGSEFLPRLILPFSVSYDHRVIDGAQGAHFAAYLSSVIGDIRRALL